jgi:dTMP kinase
MSKMIVIDGVDGSGKGVQTRRLYQAFLEYGMPCILTREPGGSPAAEDIRALLVNGEPDKWDSMTELLLMVAARKAHLRDTILPALEQEMWVISDRFADSSRAFQGIAGEIGLDTVDKLHALCIGEFKPDLVIILDIDERIALARAQARGGGEDRFEKKGVHYHAKVRSAFRSIAASDPALYCLVDASSSMDEVTSHILSLINRNFSLKLQFSGGG